MRRIAVLISAAFLAACVSESPDPVRKPTRTDQAFSLNPPQPKSDTMIQAGQVPYVLGHTPLWGTLFGGSHWLMIPSSDGREPIDSANRASRLHPEISGDALTYDPTVTEGETAQKVYASQWWPQTENGIAWRWNSSVKDYQDTTTDPDGLSPAEKYDALFYPGQAKTIPETKNWTWAEMQKPEEERGEAKVHPEVTVIGPTTEWEMRNQGIYQKTYPDSWWGHCNGWASYATTEPGGFPKRDIRVKLVNGKITECINDTTGCVLFRMGDIEALMTELYFSDSSTFTGRRCYDEPDKIEKDEFGRPKKIACRDVNPGTLHQAMTKLLGKGAKPLSTGQGTETTKLAFVLDHNYDYEVWNFPVTRFKIDEAEEVDANQAMELIHAANSTDPTPYQFNENATKFIRIRMRYWMVSDAVSKYQLLKPASQRTVADHEVELNYVLELDSKDKILGGEWTNDPAYSWGEDNKTLHPDFMWMGVSPKGWGESTDDLGGNSDNPFVSYSKVKALLNCANDATTCAPSGGNPPPTTNICAGACGGKSAAGCWCDAQCAQYGDCCQDAQGVGGAGVTYLCDVCSADLPAICAPATPDAGVADSTVDSTVDAGVPPDSTVDSTVDAGVIPDTTVDSTVDAGVQPDTTVDSTVDAGVAPDSTVDSTVDVGTPVNICEGYCGGKHPTGCWCNTQCVNYQDCCQDAQGTQGVDYFYVSQACGS